jgi:hypothetical protein
MEEKEISKKAAGVSAAIPEMLRDESSPAPGAESVTPHPILVDSKSVSHSAERL